jgi:hypothetical protein
MYSHTRALAAVALMVLGSAGLAFTGVPSCCWAQGPGLPAIEETVGDISTSGTRWESFTKPGSDTLTKVKLFQSSPPHTGGEVLPSIPLLDRVTNQEWIGQRTSTLTPTIPGTCQDIEDDAGFPSSSALTANPLDRSLSEPHAIPTHSLIDEYMHEASVADRRPSSMMNGVQTEIPDFEEIEADDIDDFDDYIGKRVRFTGIAGNFVRGAAVVSDSGRTLLVSGLPSWPEAVRGQSVTVTGILIKQPGHPCQSEYWWECDKLAGGPYLEIRMDFPYQIGSTYESGEAQ